MQHTNSLTPSLRRRTARRTTTTIPFWQLLALWVLIPLIIVSILLARFEWRYRNRIFPGVQVLGIDLSGMTPEDAQASLAIAVQSYTPPPVTLRYGDQIWPLSAKDMGIKVSVNDSLVQAYAAGRNGNFIQNLEAQWQLFWRGKRLQPSVSVDPGQVEQTVLDRTAHLNRSVTESHVTLSDLQVVITSAHPGQLVDTEATTSAIIRQAESGRGGIVDVQVRELPVTGAVPTASKQAIEETLSQPILISDPNGDFQFSLDPATLSSIVSWMPDTEKVGQLKPKVNVEALKPIVESWSKQVYRPPLNARFDYNTKTQQLVELASSINGYELDVDTTVSAIVDAIEKGEKQTTLAVKITKAAVASEDAPNFGIKELVARGSTKFAGSSKARVKNIEVAASKFVGVVIPPDGVFSFNEFVGDVTAANGFEDSLIIAGNRTAVGVGGGVCQVSTTVFRTSFFGGFPTIERWAHGYVVGYYGEPGIDATVYTPNVDLKFKNTTGHYLLIKPIVNTKKGILTFEFYGTNPGWKVEVGKPKYSNKKNPPPPLYIEDPSLPKGKVVQFDWAVKGMDAEVSRKVWDKDGNVLIDEVLKSKYHPWQAKFRFGPGYTPPAGAEVKWVKKKD